MYFFNVIVLYVTPSVSLTHDAEKCIMFMCIHINVTYQVHPFNTHSM